MDIELINSMGRYTQKSSTFLYPLMNLPVSPIETYLKFGDIDLPDEKLLIGLFWSEDPQYQKHKKDIKSSKYYDQTFIDDVFHIVVFSMYGLRNEYDKIIKGKYSELSDNCKSVIAYTSDNEAVVKCLYPDKNYKEFASALNIEPEMLEGRELLSPPKDDAEVLHVTKNIKKQILEQY